MKQHGAQPKFVLWTGDQPHHPKNESSLNENLVLEIIRNTTTMINNSFPGVPFYVTLGNHDYFPKSQLPGHHNRVYNETAESIWVSWLGTEENKQTFALGGYYTKLMPEVGPNVRAIIINTNLYSTNNLVTAGDPDPAGQFQWLNETLQRALVNGEKIHLITHIPPGHLETDVHVFWFRPEFNAKLLVILREYGHIILGVYSGHQHPDSFRMIYDKDNNPAAVMFISPSVTPWRARLSGSSRSSAHNPGFRRIEYNPTMYILTDIQQYYLNLTQANNDNTANWTLLYSFRSAYGVSDVTAASMQTVLNDFKKTSSAKFNSYYDYNSVHAREPSNAPCDCTCKTAHVCAIQHLDYSLYNVCMEQPGPCPPSAGGRRDHGLAVAFLLVVVAVVTTYT